MIPTFFRGSTPPPDRPATRILDTPLHMQTRLASINKMALDAGPEVEALMSDSDDELPIGWEMRTTDDGKVYYVEYDYF